VNVAADRWFFGIAPRANYARGMMHRTNPNTSIHTYLYNVRARMSPDTGNDGALFRIFGNDANAVNNPQGVEVALFDEYVLDNVNINDRVFRLDPNTLFYARLDPLGSAGHGAISLNLAELPAIGTTRTLEQVLAEINADNIVARKGYYEWGAGGELYVEFTVNTKQIVQPVQQATPAVADELYIVSTSALDTLAGLGMQKIKFDYWDASWTLHENNEVEMAGTTPVNIIGSYADVYLIKQAWGSQFGALGYNEGAILFQDNAA
jgi:hypothetical protein